MSRDLATLPERAEIPENQRWDLTLIYATEADWLSDHERVKKLIPQICAYKGSLDTADNLTWALELQFEAEIALGKLNAYAAHLYCVDCSNPTAGRLYSLSQSLLNLYNQETSWFTPELIALGEDRLHASMASSPALRKYERLFELTFRQAEHMGSAEVEQAIATLQPSTGSPGSIFETFLAGLTFPAVDDGEGNQLPVSLASYDKLCEHPNRTVRRQAFQSIYGQVARFENAIATMLIESIKGDVAVARVRGYESALAAKLAPINLSVAQYKELIAMARSHLGLLHRLLRLRQQVMGVDKLQFYDLSVPLVSPTGRFVDISFESARRLVLDSLAPMGSDYVASLQRAFDERWIDWAVNQNKMPGAFSGGSFGTPPLILLSWMGTLRSTFTLAHELGHSGHSLSSRAHQPFSTHQYTLLTAETASTVHEALLAHHLLAIAGNSSERQLVLATYLDMIRAVFFRQVLFAEFELITHTLVENGEALSASVLKDIYTRLLRDYYGDAVEIDEGGLIALECLRIPHFYNAFYVHQYAWGMISRTTIADNILQDWRSGVSGNTAVSRHLHFLASGNAADSIALLDRNGADPTSRRVQQFAMDDLGRHLGELEMLLQKDLLPR